MDEKRILIVDDDISFTRLLKMNLQEAGNYLLRIQNDAGKAVETARLFKPDLVLLDIIMPDVSGTEVAAEMRDLVEQRGMKLLFLTAAVRKDEAERHGGELNGYPVMCKPVSIEALVQRIEEEIAKT